MKEKIEFDGVEVEIEYVPPTSDAINGLTIQMAGGDPEAIGIGARRLVEKYVKNYKDIPDKPGAIPLVAFTLMGVAGEAKN